MYEHSYHIDYGAKAATYVDAFMRNIHWENVSLRHKALVAAAPAEQRQGSRSEVTATQVLSRRRPLPQ